MALHPMLVMLREVAASTRRLRFALRCKDGVSSVILKTTTIMLVVILRVAKRSRRIQTLHGFRDYARNDGVPR